MIGQNQSYNTHRTLSTSLVADVTPTVAAIGELELTGNLIPHAWYHHLKLPSGHTDLA